MLTRRRRALVTGGAGFIGSNLCRRLVAEGHDVVAVDNLMTGDVANIADLLHVRGFRFFRKDIVEAFDYQVDRIYNLACPASPRHYQRDPVHTTLTNVQGTYNALCVARRHGARLLQASTSEVYGDPQQSPQAEDYRGNVSAIGPRACYDEGKRCAETLVMDFRRSYRTEVRIARIFNTYGPGMALGDGRVVSNFITQALSGSPLTVYGDGLQTRSLCYVDDLVDGLVRLMEHDGSPEPEPMNLGNPEEITVRELAERVRRQVGRGEIVEAPLPEDDPRRRLPDVERARRALGFTPRVPLDVGLSRTIAYFERRLSERRVS